MKNEFLPFWDHVDELRKIIFRVLIFVVLFVIVAFFFKNAIFDIVLAPQKSDFITYRWLNRFAQKWSLNFLQFDAVEVPLINTMMTAQFMIHIKITIYVSLLLSSPYIVYQLFSFVSPSLYAHERKYSFRIIFFSFLLFFLGILLSYFIIFPFSFRFLATYQVDPSVQNMFNLDSYISIFLMISLLLGLLFELPILAWALGKFGIISHSLLKKYRRHAIVIIFIVAAIITPTTDIFTLLLVSVPILALYEISLLIIKREEGRRRK
jgi:sec-independent protein translocase protein TatC